MHVRVTPGDPRFLFPEPREDLSPPVRGLPRLHTETPRPRPGRAAHVGQAPRGRLSESSGYPRPAQRQGNGPDDHEFTALADLHDKASFSPPVPIRTG